MLLAEELGTSERTLRRAANRGAIRCRREGPRRISLSGKEYEYVRVHWPLLGRLIRELRTLPHVRLAVLYGSVARGDERREGDLDVLVRFREDTIHTRALVAERLEAAAGRRAQLASVDDASALLLADVLRDGLVLVDRDDDWRRLRAKERRIAREADGAEPKLDEAAWAALAEHGSP